SSTTIIFLSPAPIAAIPRSLIRRYWPASKEYWAPFWTYFSAEIFVHWGIGHVTTCSPGPPGAGIPCNPRAGRGFQPARNGGGSDSGGSSAHRRRLVFAPGQPVGGGSRCGRLGPGGRPHRGRRRCTRNCSGIRRLPVPRLPHLRPAHLPCASRGVHRTGTGPLPVHPFSLPGARLGDGGRSRQGRAAAG